jgi:hypothetical protein
VQKNRSDLSWAKNRGVKKGVFRGVGHGGFFGLYWRIPGLNQVLGGFLTKLGGFFDRLNQDLPPFQAPPNPYFLALQTPIS